MRGGLHPIAGGIAFMVIATFWLSTALSEAFGSTATIVMVKRAIPWGFLLLIPALAFTGASGVRLAYGWSHPLTTAKQRRMPIIAANGLLILVPSALYLAHLAGQGDFSLRFQLVQALELAAGAVNLALIGLNIRDGLRLGQRG